MIITTTTPAAQKLGKAFQTPGAVKKEYVARVKGCFPEGEEVVCDEPLLTIDRQIGVNVVHPEGRVSFCDTSSHLHVQWKLTKFPAFQTMLSIANQPSKTLFKRLSYDPETDTSVVRCRPITGRSHQLRVHLQFLGHPIANDPIYSDTNAWGESGGKGGIFPLVDKKTATKVEASEYKPISEAQEEAVEKMKEALTATFITSQTASSSSLKDEDTIIPSEDVSGVNTPLEPSTPLSAPSPSSSAASLSGTEGDKSQAGDKPKAKIVLRRERKESRRREGGGVNRPRDLAEFKIRYPEFNARKGAPQLNDDSTLQGGSEITLVPQAIHAINHLRKVRDEEDEYARYRDMEKPPMPPVLPSATSSNKGSSLNVNKDKATNRPQTAKRGVKNMSSKEREILAEEVRSEELIRLQEDNPEYYVAKEDKGARHCNVCGTPLLPDPKVEQLSIWLHAMRYCESRLS